MLIRQSFKSGILYFIYQSSEAIHEPCGFQLQVADVAGDTSCPIGLQLVRELIWLIPSLRESCVSGDIGLRLFDIVENPQSVIVIAIRAEYTAYIGYPLHSLSSPNKPIQFSFSKSVWRG